MNLRFIFSFLLLLLAANAGAHAEYADQLKAQVKMIEGRYEPRAADAYFRDMGIVARKADDSQTYELLGEIVAVSLFAKTDAYLAEKIKEIDRQLEIDPYPAVSQIAALLKSEKVYEPSADFLETSMGKSLAGEMAKQRQEALSRLKANPSMETFVKALGAYRKSALFSIKNAQVETDLNNLRRELGCTVGWKKKITLRFEEKFKTEYEQGIVIQEAELMLQTSADNYAAAEWKGPWIYRYTGRDGVGEGKSEAILKARRGQYETEIIIGAARLSSTGRFNFPVTLNTVKRLIELHPPRLFPRAELFEQKFSLTGCPDEAPKQPAKVQNRTGKVLLG